MTTHPDPVRASFEAWARRHGVSLERHSDNAGTYKHLATDWAWSGYRAASKVDELEREWCEASYAKEVAFWEFSDSCTGPDEDEAFRRLKAAEARHHAAFSALRLHRTPPKVDRVRAALDLLAQSPYCGWRIDEIRDLLTDELEARKEAK